MLHAFVLVLTILVPHGDDITHEIGTYDSYVDCFYGAVEARDANPYERTYHCELRPLAP